MRDLNEVYFVIYMLTKWNVSKGKILNQLENGIYEIDDHGSDKVYLIQPNRVFRNRVEARKRANILNSNRKIKKSKFI